MDSPETAYAKLVAAFDADSKVPIPARDLLLGVLLHIAHDEAGAAARFEAAVADGLSQEAVAQSVALAASVMGMPAWTKSGWRLASGPSPGVGTATRDHYEEELGEVPEPIARLAATAPRFFEEFIRFRRALISDSAVPPAMRELLLAVFSAEAGYEDGGRRHLRAARRHGLDSRTLAEVLSCLLLTTGIVGWQRTGRILWDEFSAEQG